MERFTGTGLDRLVDIIENDTGVRRQVSDADLDAGAQAAGELNHLLLEGIESLGLANDGTIDTAEVRGLSDWIRSDSARLENYRDLYGRGERGFQLVENEDSDTRLFGEDAIDEVADAIYSIGFGYDGDGRLRDVNGNPYRSVNITSDWLNNLLSDSDFAELSNSGGALVVEGTTGTGLDRVIEIIQSDPGLIRNVSQADIAVASRAVDGMNHLYLEGMSALGLASDGTVERSEVVALDAWIRADPERADAYEDMHTDWLRIYNQGATIDQVDGFHDGVHPHIGHVVNHGFRGIYEIGYGTDDGMLLGPNGTPNVTARLGGAWFDYLLSDAEKQALDEPYSGQAPDSSAPAEEEPESEPETDAAPETSTGDDETTTSTTGDDQTSETSTGGEQAPVSATETGLDRLVDIINSDAGLARNVSQSGIDEAADAAAAMNDIIVDAIGTLGLADDGRINDRDVEKLNTHLRGDDALHDEFLLLYGTASDDGDTGFETVRGNGGDSTLFGKWVVNNVADAVYHLGFEIEQNMFFDANGDESYSVKRVAEWIDDLYFA